MNVGERRGALIVSLHAPAALESRDAQLVQAAEKDRGGGYASEQRLPDSDDMLGSDSPLLIDRLVRR